MKFKFLTTKLMTPHLHSRTPTERRGLGRSRSGNGITSSETISLEIRFHMIAPNDLFWRVELTSNSTDFSGLLSGRDLVYFGDAPNTLPQG